MMKRPLQNLALFAYRLLNASGAMNVSVVQRGFESAYHLYKAKLEASQIERLRPFITPGTTVIDVGANIGFFALRFSNWVSSPGKVIAIEPEQLNLERLERAVGRRGLLQVIEVVRGAAADLDGMLHLVLNRHHPADHRLGVEGVPVAAFTLDRLMADRDWPAVSLVKIDVQGAEMRVLNGGAALLRRCHPALYIEIDDAALAENGTCAKAVLDYLAGFGYEMFELKDGGAAAIDSASAATKRARRGYEDYLFKPTHHH